jgi:Zn-finger nucleic acid-binding protein
MLGGGPQAASIAEARHVPVREPGRAGAAVCPECGHQLTNYTYAYDSAVEVDGCEHCGGVFLEDGELAAIQKWGEEQSRPDANVEALAAMVSASERTKRRAERIGALARVAMMRRSWLVWDTSDLLEPVDLDHD